MTTAASADCGRLLHQSGHDDEQQGDRAGPHQPGELGRAPACSATGVLDELLLTGKPWNKPAGDVGGPEGDHLLVRVDR